MIPRKEKAAKLSWAWLAKEHIWETDKGQINKYKRIDVRIWKTVSGSEATQSADDRLSREEKESSVTTRGNKNKVHTQKRLEGNPQNADSDWVGVADCAQPLFLLHSPDVLWWTWTVCLTSKEEKVMVQSQQAQQKRWWLVLFTSVWSDTALGRWCRKKGRTDQFCSVLTDSSTYH